MPIRKFRLRKQEAIELFVIHKPVFDSHDNVQTGWYETRSKKLTLNQLIYFMLHLVERSQVRLSFLFSR